MARWPKLRFHLPLIEPDGRFSRIRLSDKDGIIVRFKCAATIRSRGPVVNCNVTKRGWMDGIGGCSNFCGICIGCTMPGFPDKFMRFIDEEAATGGIPRR